MKKLAGMYSFKTYQLTNNSMNCFSYKDDDIFIQICGNVSINDNINNAKLIKDYYKENKQSITEFISGIYLLLIYDKKDMTLLIAQDKMTSPLTLYYCEVNNKLYFNTNLKELLLDSKIERKLNDNCIEEFAINGYIYGSETLTKNVYKIKSFNALYADKDGVRQMPVKYPYKKLSEEEGTNQWTETLQNSIEECFKDESEISIPLSSGYDSNYILYTIREKSDIPVNAFSVGGKFGKNELPQVKENVKLYKNLNLHTALTDNNTLKNMCDIVWRLDGNVYEVGLFLQYELANLCNKNNVKTLVCGECADQVMNINFNEKSSLFPDKKQNEVIHYVLQQYPYIFGSQMILKKNGIMFNSYDIETRYPFLNTDFMNVADSVKNLNGTSKAFHAKKCKEAFPTKIVENMSKVGGSTECHSLFESESDIDDFFKSIEETNFYKSNIDIMKKIAKKNNKFFIQKVKGKLKKIANSKKSSEPKSKTTAENNTSNANGSKSLLGKWKYYKREMKLQQYLCYLYIIVFNELFISGKYDTNFANAGTDVKLDKIINIK